MADVTGTFYRIAEDVKEGYGAELLVGVGDASPETFVAVKGVVSIKPFSLTRERVRTTHLRSPRKAHEYRSGMGDYDAFTCKARWLPDEDSQSNQAGNGTTVAPGLLYLYSTGQIVNFVLRLYDGSPQSEFPFSGFISKYSVGELNENDNSVDLDFDVSPVADPSESLP